MEKDAAGSDPLKLFLAYVCFGIDKGLSAVDGMYRVWSTGKCMNCFQESKCLSVMVCTNLHLVLNLTRRIFTKPSLHLLHPARCFHMQEHSSPFQRCKGMSQKRAFLPRVGSRVLHLTQLIMGVPELTVYRMNEISFTLHLPQFLAPLQAMKS